MTKTIVKEWVTEEGFKAKIARIDSYETWVCGYVGVPRTHPLFNVPYSGHSPYTKMPEKEMVGKRGSMELFLMACRGEDEPSCVYDFFDVHGSLTFSDFWEGEEEDFWYFGFDCHHAGDSYDVQNERYAEEECISLSRQLKERVDEKEFVDFYKED